MTLTDKDIHHLAWLARLGIDEQESHRLQADIAGILAYVAMLGDSDTSRIKPTAHVDGLTTICRDDTVRTWSDPDEVLACAPSTHARYIKVSSILE